MKKLYVVTRVYSDDDRAPDERYSFYGWTFSKTILKAFLKQRDPKKYVYKEFHKDDEVLLKAFPEIDDGPRSEKMIDYVKLQMASTKEEMYLFITLSELKEAELRIQKRFHDMASIDDMDILNLFMHLDKYYLDALEFLGFRPKEVDYIYDTSDSRDNYNTYDLAESEIEEAYAGAGLGPEEEFTHYTNPPGLNSLSQISDKTLYSMENFITALIDEL